jgi:sulfotransferase family protein
VKKIVYIMSDNRSGSTLLDQLLGAHESVISLGEVHHLPAYALLDRSLYNPVHPLECSCGTIVETCEFWSPVERQLGQPFETLLLKPRFFEWSDGAVTLSQRARNRIRGTLSRNPGAVLNSAVAKLLKGPRVARDSFALFDAVFDQTAATHLVDSSKSPFRYRMLFDARPNQIYAIMLGRDYRGIAYSNTKRGGEVAASTRSWVLRMQQIKRVTADVPKEQLIRVRYEDLCSDPRAEITRICQYLNLDFSENLLSRPSGDLHHIGGSPSKFDPGRKKIELDQSYFDAFTKSELAMMKDIVGDIAAEWGYE